MATLSLKSLSSKLAKATFLASVPKLQPEVASILAPALKAFIEVLGTESREQETLQELLDALPVEAKKD